MCTISRFGGINFCNFNTGNLSKVSKNAKIQTHLIKVSTYSKPNFTELKASKVGMKLL